MNKQKMSFSSVEKQFGRYHFTGFKVSLTQQLCCFKNKQINK